MEEYLKESFKEYALIENRLRELELQMANDDQNLELVLQKYGKLQEKYIALGGFQLEEKFKKICSGFKFDSHFLKKEYNSCFIYVLLTLSTYFISSANILSILYLEDGT